MSEAIHSKAIIEEVYKSNAERLLYLIKVKPKFISKFIMIMIILILSSIMAEWVNSIVNL